MASTVRKTPGAAKAVMKQPRLRRSLSSPNDALNVVRGSLQEYADRGVFRGLSQHESRGGQVVFTFDWLMNRPMRMSVDAAKHELRFRDLLPGVPATSSMYAELKNYVRQRHEPALPSHRRIDSARAQAACSNRGGQVSISLVVKNGQYAYGVNRIVNLVHELFVHLRDVYPDYLVESFDVPQE
jgi:hypothetical protein